MPKVAGNGPRTAVKYIEKEGVRQIGRGLPRGDISGGRPAGATSRSTGQQCRSGTERSPRRDGPISRAEI